VKIRMRQHSPVVDVATFDYGGLDEQTRILVQERTGEIKGLMRRTVEDILAIGQKLVEVKAHLAHGQFGTWLQSEFRWSQDTAENFMRVAKRFGEIPNVAEFAPSVLYVLAAPSTPEAAIEEAIHISRGSEQITVKNVRAIVRRHQAGVAPEPIADPQVEEDEEWSCPNCGDSLKGFWHCQGCGEHRPLDERECLTCQAVEEPEPASEAVAFELLRGLAAYTKLDADSIAALCPPEDAADLAEQLESICGLVEAVIGALHALAD
jgi:hypothetical protein